MEYGWNFWQSFIYGYSIYHKNVFAQNDKFSNKKCDMFLEWKNFKKNCGEYY